MKKDNFDTTALLTFFICIPCETTIKSVQCKPGASRSAGPQHKKFSRAYNNILSAANKSSDAKVRSKGGQFLNIYYAASCDSLLALSDAHRL
jgi:phosphatidylserine decarboxylase